ncbi:MAG: hypothetical protein V1870_02505 [Candidatus Aenigmatarchaeota archaeon]
MKYKRFHNSEDITPDSVAFSRENFVGKLKNYNGKDDLIAEEYIDGPEVCSGFVGNNPRIMLPVVEFVFNEYSDSRPKIRDFDAKWKDEREEHTQGHLKFAELPEEVIAKINRYTSTIADVFDIKDYARFDFRLKKKKNGFTPYIIDINANPDINSDATLYKMAEHMGLNYTQFVGIIVDSAFKRYGK